MTFFDSLGCYLGFGLRFISRVILGFFRVSFRVSLGFHLGFLSGFTLGFFRVSFRVSLGFLSGCTQINSRRDSWRPDSTSVLKYFFQTWTNSYLGQYVEKRSRFLSHKHAYKLEGKLLTAMQPLWNTIQAHIVGEHSSTSVLKYCLKNFRNKKYLRHLLKTGLNSSHNSMHISS